MPVTVWARSPARFDPAERSSGTWTTPAGELTLTQEFQMVSGTMKQGSVSVPVSEGRLRGDEITFAVAGNVYKGKVNGDTIQGTTAKGTSWTATRTAR